MTGGGTIEIPSLGDENADLPGSSEQKKPIQPSGEAQPQGGLPGTGR